MPRAFLKTKNRGGHKTYKCSVCKEEIAPGDQYYTWKFNRGSRYFQHATHGHPRRSQLTQSKMGEVWDAVDAFDVSQAEQPEPIFEALQAVADVAESVASEYNDAADSIESSFPSGNPTSEACRATAEALESWASDLTSWQPDYDSWREAKEAFDTKEDWIEDLRQQAQDVVDDQPEYQG